MKRFMLIAGMILVLITASIIGVTFGISGNVQELASEIKDQQVDAILASAEVKDQTLVSVPVLYYRQVSDTCVDMYNAALLPQVEKRQFEWSKCGYYKKAIEKELTEPILTRDYLPVGRGGKLLSNRGMAGDGYERWFHAVEGVSSVVAGTLDLQYSGKDASFTYESKKFHPVGDTLFTMNLGLPIEVQADGTETLEISADDDTWVYINNKIVLDMGGIHDAVMGRFEIRAGGEVYAAVDDEDLSYAGVKLDGGPAVIRIFHADRDSAGSTFKLKMTGMLLNVTDVVLAKSGGAEDSGVTVAYDPGNPGYIAPLGESLTTGPGRSRMITTSILAQAVALVALVATGLVTISVGRRYWRRAHNQE